VERKFSKLEEMKKAIANKPKPPAKKSPEKKKHVETVSTPKPKKANWRSAKSREKRAEKRGRLPIETKVQAVWNGHRWRLALAVPVSGQEDHVIYHQADGLFRGLEELDVKFWEWVAELTAADRLRLSFAQNPPAPESAPVPSPGGSAEAA
jgi:hypothetical protein